MIRKFLAKQFHYPQWVVDRWDDRYVNDLLLTYAQGPMDAIVERRIWLLLFLLRWKRAVAPYLLIFRLVKEIVHGRYWRAVKKIHRGADQTPGGSAGASGNSGSATGAIYPGVFTAVGGAGASAGFAGAAIPTGPGAYSTVTGGSLTVTIHGAGLGFGLPSQIEDAGIKAGEIVAYRCWRLGDDGLLYSCYQNRFLWPPGEVVHGDVDQDYGVHAFKDITAMGHYGYAYSRSKIVTGKVELWGKVIEHARGYRAEHAAILSIDDSPFYDAKAIRKRYGLKKGRAKKKPKT